MTETDEIGTIDSLLIEFKGKEINGELIPPLLDLVDRRLIRILDSVILIKAPDGTVQTLTSDDLDPQQVGNLGALAGASSGLLDDDDAAAAASILEPGSAGLMLVYENLWSIPFAVRGAPSRWPARRQHSYPGPGRPRPTRRAGSLRKGAPTMGLLGGIARTAVFAGTATAVSNRVSRRQANRWAAKDQSAYAQPQYVQQAPAAPHRSLRRKT